MESALTSTVSAYVSELVANPLTVTGGRCLIQMATIPKLHVQQEMVVVVYDHTGDIQWVCKTDNALFYQVRNHVNVVASFKCTVPFHSPDAFKTRIPGLYAPIGFIYNSVFIPYLTGTSGNNFVERGYPPGNISRFSVAPTGGGKRSPLETAYGFGCLHLPIDTIDHDGSISFKDGGGALTFNMGLSNGTVVFASGTVKADQRRLVGTTGASTSVVYFSGSEFRGFVNPLLNVVSQSLLSKTLSPMFDVNYECLHVYEGGTLLSHAERRAITHCQTQAEMLKLFDVFTRRYIAFPLFSWSTLFATHDGRLDTDLDRTAMQTMMLHYRRSPQMKIQPHLITYFDKYPSECNRLPDGWYYAYDLVGLSLEHRYHVQQDSATWRLASAPDTVLATYGISYANNQCVFQQSRWDRGFVLWQGGRETRITVEFTGGNYIQQSSTGPTNVPFSSLLVSTVRRDPRTLSILQ